MVLHALPFANFCTLCLKTLLIFIPDAPLPHNHSRKLLFSFAFLLHLRSLSLLLHFFELLVCASSPPRFIPSFHPDPSLFPRVGPLLYLPLNCTWSPLHLYLALIILLYGTQPHTRTRMLWHAATRPCKMRLLVAPLLMFVEGY